MFHRDWGVPYPETDAADGHVTNWDEIMSVIRARCVDAYPDAVSDDCGSQDNAVNRFLSYHLVPYMEDYGHLAYHANEWGWWTRGGSDAFNINVWTYFQPMGKSRRLLKLTDVARSGEKRLNRHSYYNNAFDGDYRETSCDREGILVRADNGEYVNYAVNGYYYPIDHVLLYDGYARDVVLNERIRYNVCQTMPEMMSNRIRGRSYGESPYASTCWKIPKGYCEGVETEGEWKYIMGLTVFYENNNAEFDGEVAVRLLPAPRAGVWEIRTSHPSSGIYHYFFGDSLRKDKMVDLGVRRIDISDSYFPWDVEREEDSVTFLDMARGMRLRQIMPGPASYCWRLPFQSVSINRCTLRYESSRVIIGRFYMEPERTYYLRIQTLVDTGGGDLRLSYIEMIPSTVYDNPDRAEDTW